MSETNIYLKFAIDYHRYLWTVVAVVFCIYTHHTAAQTSLEDASTYSVTKLSGEYLDSSESNVYLDGGGIIRLRARTAGFGTTSDSIVFAHVEVVGDFTIEAHNVRVTDSSSWTYSKSGIMLRKDLTIGSPFMAQQIWEDTPELDLRIREIASSTAGIVPPYQAYQAPVDMRMSRVGTTIKLEYRDDVVGAWTEYDEREYSFLNPADSLYLGVFLASQNTSITKEVTFENVVVSGGGIGSPPSNTPPSSDPIVINIDEDGPNPQGGDAHPDADSDGDSLSSTADTVVGTYGTFDIATNGTYSYTLDNSNSIIDTLDDGESPDPVEQAFSITVTDGVNDPVNRDVTVNISGSNDRPVLIGDANPSLASATEGDASYASHDFGGSFTDPEDGVNLTYNITGKPSWLDFSTAGVLSLASGQAVGPAGSYPMAVSVTDSGDPALAPATNISFTLTVDTAPPPPPPPPVEDEVPESTANINQQIIFLGATAGSSQTDGARIDASGANLDIVNQNASNINIVNNGNNALSIDSNGVITIGATASSSDHELEVNGLIRAEGVVVEALGGADFVFEDGYDLPTLGEVEKHIDSKGHLPGVPSAADMENGISIGESHKILLQKVEELTLYLIEKDKQVEELKRELLARDKQFEVLIQEIEKLKSEKEAE